MHLVEKHLNGGPLEEAVRRVEEEAVQRAPDAILSFGDLVTDVDNLEQFGQDFNLLIEKHEMTKIVVRLTRVKYMTSMAIGKLITLHRKLQRMKGKLVLCELMPDVAATLEAAKLLTYFTTTPDLALALAAIQSPA